MAGRFFVAGGERVGPGSQRRPDFASLRSGADFTRVYRTGVRRRIGGITVISAAGESGSARIGFVAGRKVGTAVARNRAKRRLRAAACLVMPAPGTDYVIVATVQVNEAPFDSLVGWVGQGLRRDSLEEYGE